MQTMYNSLMLQLLFKQVLIMYILMFFGYFAYKKKLIPDILAAYDKLSRWADVIVIEAVERYDYEAFKTIQRVINVLE